MEATDHQLMVAVAAGNLGEMSQIYERRHRALFRFFFRLSARQAVAEDLVHEVFLRMIRFRHTYTAGDGFEAWMYRIARNVFVDQTRKHRLEIQSGENDFEPVDTARLNALESVSKQQELSMLYRALRALPDEKRELIVMARFQGLSHEQIGSIVGCEAGTVKVRIFRAVKDVGKILHGLRKEKAS